MVKGIWANSRPELVRALIGVPVKVMLGSEELWSVRGRRKEGMEIKITIPISIVFKRLKKKSQEKD